MRPMNREQFRTEFRAHLARPTAGRWFDIKNADGAQGDTAVVRIYDYIDWLGVTAESFAAELDTITAAKIEVQINSPGGDVWDGIAIFNALRAHPAHITTRVDGMAASAASVIVQAGDHRVMMHAGQMMIHDAWGVFVGNADEMRAFAEVLDQQSSIIADIYATRAGGDHTADEFRQLMRDETWLKDQAAVDLGLADEVLTPSAVSTPEPTDSVNRQARQLLGAVSDHLNEHRDGAERDRKTAAVVDQAVRRVVFAELERRIGNRELLQADR